MLFGCTSGMNEESNTDSSVKDSALQYEEEIDDNTEDINLKGTEVNESAPTTKTEEDMNSDSGKESSEETESDEQMKNYQAILLKKLNMLGFGYN